MTKLANNVKVLDAVRITSGKGREKHSIKGVPGISLVAYKTGRKVFWGDLRTKDGKRTSIELGEYDRERFGPKEAIAKLRAERERRERPIDERDEVTFDELFREWLERHAKAKLATWADEERRYQMHLRDKIGDRKFASLERKDVREIRDQVSEKAGPIQSNRVVALFQRVANWAVDEDRARFNPAARLKKTGEEKRRERVLTDEEIRRIWTEITKSLEVDVRHSDGTRAQGGLTETDLPAAKATRIALQLLFLTGQRRGEVAGMRWAELDLEGGWWSLPATRTKNSLPHRVPLSGKALEVLQQAHTDSRGEFVFCGKDGRTAIIPDAVTKALQRICKRLEINGVGPHDIRRTIGTRLRIAGVGVEERGYLFNHVSGAKAKVTSWNYDAGEHDTEKRRAITVWEHVLMTIIKTDQPTNVITLARG